MRVAIEGTVIATLKEVSVVVIAVRSCNSGGESQYEKVEELHVDLVVISGCAGLGAVNDGAEDMGK